MPDSRFYQTGSALSVDEALALARLQDRNAQLVGDPGGDVARVAGPEAPDLTGAVIFLARVDVAPQFAGRRFGLVVGAAEHVEAISADGPVIETKAAKRVFAAIANALHGPRADEGAAAAMGAGVTRHETAIIGAGAEIGDGCIIGPYAVIGPGVRLGEACVIGASSSVHFSILGDRVRIGAGVRLGGDGFGFNEGPTGAVRAPQLGRLMIGDDVEIDANCTIDRGALGDTVIGAGAKIDNLVHIAHNVRIGENCLIAGQVGFAGGCELGDGVMVGGQAGFATRIKVGAGARIAAQAGVITDVPAGESWGGTPAMPHRTWLRSALWAARHSKRKADEK